MKQKKRQVGTAVVLAVVVMLATASTVGAIISNCVARHIVKSGETLSEIALDWGVSVNDLMQTNDLTNPDFIWVGQSLCIPGSKTKSPPTPTWIPLTTRTHYPCDLDTYGRYRVQTADTGNKIASKCGITFAVLEVKNPGINWKRLGVGTALFVSRTSPGYGEVVQVSPTRRSTGKVKYEGAARNLVSLSFLGSGYPYQLKKDHQLGWYIDETTGSFFKVPPRGSVLTVHPTNGDALLTGGAGHNYGWYVQGEDLNNHWLYKPVE